MKENKLIIIILIIFMCPILFCGCWNYREIDNLAIVAGMAIDKDIKTNKYIVTTEIVTPQNQGASSNISSELYSCEGDSISSAVTNTIEKTGLNLFWSHSKVVLISESVAKEGIIPVIDWINRDAEPRSDMWILIAKGSSASEILKHKVKLNEIVSFHLNDIMQAGEPLSKFIDSRLNSFIEEIASEGKSSTVATVKNEPSDSTIAPRISGSAIIKSDKLVGYLDGNQTLYMLMIKNRIKNGLINLKNVSGSDTSVTLEIFNNRTKLTPLLNKGALSMKIDIYPVVAITEVEGTKDFMKEENLKILQREAEKKIEDQVQYLITKLQKDYDSDVLGFGETFEREKPKVTETFKKNGDDIFVNLKTNVKVHLQIKGSGETVKTISIGK